MASVFVAIRSPQHRHQIRKTSFATTIIRNSALATILLGGTAWAQTSYFWDSDGTTAGFGNTTGTWGTSAYWSTSSAGTAATANSTITTNDTVNFGTATLNYTNATVTGPATAQGFLNMNFGSGQTTALTLSGGTLNLAPVSTIAQNRSDRNMEISSVLQGSGSALVVNGTGTLTLSGNNTFTGGLTLTNTGQLTLAHANAAGTGTILLASTQTGANVTLGITGGITVTNPISINSATGREGINSTGTGNNSLTGGITITGSTSRTIYIGNSQTSGNLTVSGGINGASFPGLISLRGSQVGNVGFLNGAVTTSGTMDVNGSTFWTLNTAGSSYTQFSFGAVSGGAILGANNAIATNARLEVSASATGSLDLNGFNQSLAGLTAGSASFSITNSSATTDSTLTLASLTADRSFAGVIRDGATRKVSLVLNSAGRLQQLTAANTFSGSTTVTAGTLAIGNNLALQNSALDTTGGGIVTFSVTTPTIGGLSGSVNLGTKFGTGYSAVTSLTLNPQTGVTANYSGVIANGAAGMTLTKTGSGTQIFSGASANTYSGTTTVSAGTLQLNKSTGVNAIAGNVVVTNVGSVLLISSSNQVADGAAVTLSGGTIAKGSGAISETLGDLTLSANSDLDFGIGGTGNFTFATYNPSTFQLRFQNFNLGNSLTITTGTFTASQFNFNGFDYSFSNVPSGGFTITAVPEPSTVLAALGLAGLMLWPMRRQFVRPRKAAGGH